MSKKLFLAFALLALPAVAGAQARLGDILETINDLLNVVVPIVMVLALIYFFYGLAQFIFNSGDEEKRGQGKHIMIWGIIALFVMASVWGLVGVIQNTFSVGRGRAPDAGELIPR